MDIAICTLFALLSQARTFVVLVTIDCGKMGLVFFEMDVLLTVAVVKPELVMFDIRR